MNETRWVMGVRAAAWSMRVCGPTVLESLLGRVRRDVCDERIAWWSRRLLDDVGVTLEVRGREHIDASGPVVVMSNHQSLYDVPVLYQVLPGSVRMVAKTELFRIPLFGRALRAAEFIEVDRSNHARAIASLRAARHLLERGVTVWIAPEGTRSRDGTLLPFKKGGFVLAEEMNAPIIPISIDGTRHILPARTTDLHLGQRVVVSVHPPVAPDRNARSAVIAKVRAYIEAGMG